MFSIFEGGRVNARDLAATATDDGTGSHDFARIRNAGVLSISGDIDGFSTAIDAQESAIVNFAGSISNASQNGIVYQYGSVVSARSAVISGCGNVGVLGLSGSTISIPDGSITGSGTRDIDINQGSFVDASNSDTTNGTGGPDGNDTAPATFNSLSDRGVIWA